MLMEINLSLKHFSRKLKIIKSDIANLKESELEILELKNIVIKLEVVLSPLIFSNNDMFLVEIMQCWWMFLFYFHFFWPSLSWYKVIVKYDHIFILNIIFSLPMFLCGNVVKLILFRILCVLFLVFELFCSCFFYLIFFISWLQHFSFGNWLT